MIYSTSIPKPTAVETDASQISLIRAKDANIRIISPEQALAEIAAAPVLAVDTETTGLIRPKDQVVFWSMSDGKNRYSLPRRFLPAFSGVLQDPDKHLVFHNANYDGWMLKNSGVDLALPNHRKVYRRWDTMVMHTLLADNQPHDLKSLSKKLLGVHMPSFAETFNAAEKDTGIKLRESYLTDPQKVIEYASKDAWCTFKLLDRFMDGLRKVSCPMGNMLGYYQWIEQPTHDVSWQMEREGLRLDVHACKKKIAALEDIKEQKEKALYRIVGQVFNVNSPAQIREILYQFDEDAEVYIDEFGNDAAMTKGGESGVKAAATDKKVLLKLKSAGSELAIALLEYRQVDTVLKYLKGYDTAAAYTGRVHTTLSQSVARTGRFCVAEDTMLSTTRGTFRISDLDLTGKHQNVKIMTHRGRMRRILGLCYKGQEEMFRVTLENGATITCTANHRFLTSRGWCSLRNIQDGDRIWSDGGALRGSPYTWGRKPNYAVRAGVQASVSRGEADRQGDPRAVPRYRQADTRLCQAALPRQVWARAQGVTCTASRRCDEGEQARDTGSTLPTHRPGDAVRPPRHGEIHSTRCQGAQHKRVPGTGQHEAPRTGTSGPASREDAGYRPGLPGEARGASPRHHCSGVHILRRPAALLSNALRGALQGTRACVVHPEDDRGAQDAYRDGEAAKRPHQLEDEPLRTEALHGPDPSKDTAHQRIYSGRQLPRGLRVPRLPTAGGAGWGIPHDPTICERQRCTERGSGPGEGATDSQVPVQSGRRGPRRGSRRDLHLARVAIIEPVGVQGVWDIEVEEDHSYVAQGFVNHNSSKQPNMQNVKREDDYGVRKLFIADDGEVISDSDFAQVEMRIAAARSGDQNMVTAIRGGKDLHCWTAHKMFEHPYEDYMAAIAAKDAISEAKEKKEAYIKLTPWQEELLFERQASKSINFGIIYGETAYKLAEQLSRSHEYAQGLLDSYWVVYSGLKEYMGSVEEFVAENWYSVTALGRRRQIPQAMLANVAKKEYRAGMRAAGNFPIQAEAAELIKLAQIRIWEDDYLYEAGFRQCLQVHDEIIGRLPEKASKDPELKARYCAHKTMPLGPGKPPLPHGIQLETELKFAKNWGDAK